MQKPLLTKYIIVAILLSLIGCAALENHLQKPTVQYAGSHLVSATLYDAELNFLIHVDNPNPIGLPIQGLNYSLDINHKKLLSGSAQHDAQIPANSGIDLSLPVVIRYEDFLEGLLQLKDQDAFEYTLQGDIDLGVFQLPYHASGTLPLPKLPQIRLKSIKVQRYTLENIETSIQINIANGNDFALRANGLTYQLLLNNIATISGESSQAIDVPAHSDATVAINNKFNLVELGKVFDIFRRGNNVNAVLTGQLDIPVANEQNKLIPFSWSGDTDITH